MRPEGCSACGLWCARLTQIPHCVANRLWLPFARPQASSIGRTEPLRRVLNRSFQLHQRPSRSFKLHQIGISSCTHKRRVRPSGCLLRRTRVCTDSTLSSSFAETHVPATLCYWMPLSESIPEMRCLACIVLWGADLKSEILWIATL